MSDKIKKREGSKFRLNAFDIAFILFVIVVIVFAIIRTDVIRKITSPDEQCEIELSVDNLDLMIDDTYNDKEIFFESGVLLGTVKNSKIETAGASVNTGSSAVNPSAQDGAKKRTLTLVVSATLKHRDGKYYSKDGDLIISGAELELHGKTFTLNCTVKSVNSAKN